MKVKMQSPWVNWSNSVRELFKLDPEIRMTWSDKSLELHIYVKNNVLKRLAIRELLPTVKVFDKTRVKIIVSDEAGRRGGAKYTPELVDTALKGNPLYHYMHIWDDPTATNNPFCWVELDNRVIQYPNDDLSALYGDRSCLPEDLAKEVLGTSTDHIFYDTVNPDRPIPDDDGGKGPFGLVKAKEKAKDIVKAKKKAKVAKTKKPIAPKKKVKAKATAKKKASAPKAKKAKAVAKPKTAKKVVVVKKKKSK